MPTASKKTIVAMATEAALPPIPSGWLDQLVTGPMTPEAVESMARRIKKAVIERALGGVDIQASHMTEAAKAMNAENRSASLS